MNRSKLTRTLALLACALVTQRALAQLVPAETRTSERPRRVAAVPSSSEVSAGGTSASNTSPGDPAIVLSPFEVNAEQDHGYLATSAQSGTRLRSDLKDIAE